MDERELDELQKTNGIPRWLARLEPVWSYLRLAVAVAVFLGFLAGVGWTLGFAFGLW